MKFVRGNHCMFPFKVETCPDFSGTDGNFGRQNRKNRRHSELVRQSRVGAFGVARCEDATRRHDALH